MNLEQVLDRPVYKGVPSPTYADIVAIASMAMSRDIPDSVVDKLGENTQRSIMSVRDMPDRLRPALFEINLIALENSIVLDRGARGDTVDFVAQTLRSRMDVIGGLLILHDWDMTKVDMGEE